MSKSIESYYKLLDIKCKNISKSDFRFYNLGHLPIIISKTHELSTICSACKSNLMHIDKLVNMLPDCMNISDQRKVFDKEKNKIEEHLKTDHGMRAANYYLAWYAVVGVIVGSVFGLLFNLLINKQISIDYIAVPGVAGLMIAQVFGKRKDRKSLKKQVTY